MAGKSLFRVGKDVELWRVLIYLSILALFLVAFEKALHHLEHKVSSSRKFQQMIKKVCRELMILGLISLGLKLIKEMVEIDSYSKTMIAFQVADLTIFFLALALIVQSTCIFLLLRNQYGRADRAELVTTQDLANSVNSPEGQLSFAQKIFCCGRAAKRKAVETELIKLRLLRHFFLRRFGLPQLFPFSKYLYRAQVSQISHMIEVEPVMWVLLLVVAWMVCGLVEVYKAVGEHISDSHDLVEAFVLFAWILMALHVAVMLFFRSCMQKFVRAAGFHKDKNVLAANLKIIAEEEAADWKREDADSALEVMSWIQERHEEIEYCHAQGQQNSLAGTQVTGEDLGYFTKMEEATENDGALLGSPIIQIRYFNRKIWHVVVIFLLILNGFFITLFAQCAVYDLDEIYKDFGPLVAVMLGPIPLLLSALVFQPRIFYDFVILSNTLHIDASTLSDVVETFSEVVRLRSEFVATLAEHLTQQELDVSDLQDEMQARDPGRSGFIEVDELRSVLAKFGFFLSRFRFNTVVKLLFELENTRLAYAQVVELVAMAQNEHGAATVSVRFQQSHALLRQSTLFAGSARLSRMQSSSILFSSARHFPIVKQPSVGTEPQPDSFVRPVAGSFVLSVLSQRSSPHDSPHQARPYISRSMSETEDTPGILKL